MFMITFTPPPPRPSLAPMAKPSRGLLAVAALSLATLLVAGCTKATSKSKCTGGCKTGTNFCSSVAVRGPSYDGPMALATPTFPSQAYLFLSRSGSTATIWSQPLEGESSLVLDSMTTREQSTPQQHLAVYLTSHPSPSKSETPPVSSDSQGQSGSAPIHSRSAPAPFARLLTDAAGATTAHAVTMTFPDDSVPVLVYLRRGTTKGYEKALYVPGLPQREDEPTSLALIEAVHLLGETYVVQAGSPGGSADIKLCSPAQALWKTRGQGEVDAVVTRVFTPGKVGMMVLHSVPLATRISTRDKLTLGMLDERGATGVVRLP